MKLAMPTKQIFTPSRDRFFELLKKQYVRVTALPVRRSADAAIRELSSYIYIL